MYAATTIASLVLLSLISQISGDDSMPYNDTPCDRLQLTMAPGKLHFVSGIYRLKYNASLMFYTHECRSLHLYQVHGDDGDAPTWVIGPSIDAKRGYIMTTNLTGTNWKRRNGSLQSWVIDDAISSKCDDTCHAFNLGGGKAPASLRGSYQREPSYTHNGLPVYKRHEMDGSVVYVYHNVLPCRHWAIGSSVGGSKPFFFSMSAQGNLLNNEQWWVNHIAGPVKILLVFECHEKLSRNEVKCGERRQNLEAQEFIVNGADASKGDWPFMVSYKRAGGHHKCGAVIVSRRWILTAGHCVPMNDETEMTMIQVGVHDMQDPDKDSVSYAVRRTLHNPEFKWRTDNFKLVNDVGLIELHTDLIFNAFIQPVCLPSFTNDTFSFSSHHSASNFTSCFLVGWGEQWYKGPPGVLQRASIASVEDVDQCATHRVFSQHLSWMRDVHSLCIQTERRGRICKGDSGSPLLCERNGRWFVLGVASWSLSQCYTYVSGIPSIYEHVAPWIHWIRQHV